MLPVSRKNRRTNGYLTIVRSTQKNPRCSSHCCVGPKTTTCRDGMTRPELPRNPKQRWAGKQLPIRMEVNPLPVHTQVSSHQLTHQDKLCVICLLENTWHTIALKPMNSENSSRIVMQRILDTCEYTRPGIRINFYGDNYINCLVDRG